LTRKFDQVWNCHRAYGPRRLTLLLERWTVVGVLGLDEGMFETVRWVIYIYIYIYIYIMVGVLGLDADRFESFTAQTGGTAVVEEQ
jgi:hypothetical protein